MGSEYQREWRMAMHAVLLALGRKVEDGGMSERALVSCIKAELHLDEKPIKDALDHLVRDKLISREHHEGLLGSDDHYCLEAAGIEVMMGKPHQYLKFQVDFELKWK